jgi:hypothetical protein
MRQPNGREDGRRRQISNEDGAQPDAGGIACAMEACVRDHVGSSSIVMFGVGVALGSALVMLLGPSHRHPTRRQIARASWESVRDAVSEHMPDALARFMAKA